MGIRVDQKNTDGEEERGRTFHTTYSCTSEHAIHVYNSLSLVCTNVLLSTCIRYEKVERPLFQFQPCKHTRQIVPRITMLFVKRKTTILVC